MHWLTIYAVLGFVYAPILMLCVHFALKKHGNPISGVAKKTMLGCLAFSLWFPFFWGGFYILNSAGWGASDIETVIAIVGCIVFWFAVPPFLMAYTMQKIGPRWAKEEINPKIWQKVGINTFVRFGIIVSLLLSIQQGLLR